jgi:MSHA pilin protein MshD
VPAACVDRLAVAACASGSACWGPEPDEDPAQTSTFDDVDDFHGLAITGNQLVNIVNTSLASEYRSYKVCVDVRYAGSDLGSQLDNRSAKKITVSVVTPLKEQIDFAAYRSNW